MGDLVTVNANGDSSDTYYNIMLDPLFRDPESGDVRLQWGSPAIDAGDPTFPLDSDSTVADIGAFYFDQRQQDIIPPSVPQNLSAVAGDTTVTLTFSANPDTEGVAFYVVYRDTRSFTPISIRDSLATTPDTIYIDDRVIGGVTYYYRVSAVDTADNESGYSDEVSATPTGYTPHLTVTLPDTYAVQRDTISVPIRVDDTTDFGIYSADITLTFSEPVLTALGASKRGTIAAPWDTMVVNTTLAGRIVIAMAGSEALSGSGVLVFVDFVAVGSDSTALEFESFMFNEGDPPVYTVDGGLTVLPLLYSLSGDVSYYSNGSPVDSVTVTLDGRSALTGADGLYQFEVAPGDYTVKAAKSFGAIHEPSITAYDAAFILRHSAELDTLEGYAFLAGDVTANGEVTSFDASYVLRYVVGLVEAFPVGADWAFFPDSLVYAPLDSNVTDADFVGLVYGDVTGNWSAGAGKLVAEGIRRLWMGPPLTASGDVITVPIEIDDATGVLSAEMTLAYDPAKLELLSISTTGLSAGGLLAYRAEGEVVKIALARGSEMNHGGALVNLSFRRRPPISDFRFPISDLTVKAAELNEGRIGAVVETVSQPQGIPEAFALSQNVPNPFNATTTIAYHLPESSKVSLSIYNTLGERVRTLVEDRQEAGSYAVSWDGRDDAGRAAASGVYLCRMEAGTFVRVRKVVLLK